VAAYKSIQRLIHTNFNDMSPKMDSTIFKNSNYVSDLNLEIPQWMMGKSLRENSFPNGFLL